MVSEQEMLELYDKLEPWAVEKSRCWSIASGLSRWADDIAQEARVALWRAITAYDGKRHNGERESMIRQLSLQYLKHAMRKYRNWEAHELQILDEDVPN